MKRLQPNMIPDSIVIVVGANGVTTDWVLDETESVKDVYAHYKLHYPESKIRVFVCGVQQHARPVEEVPLDKLKQSKNYPLGQQHCIFYTATLDRDRVRNRPIDINHKYEVEDGWQRVLMARRDGWTTIPCRMTDK